MKSGINLKVIVYRRFKGRKSGKLFEIDVPLIFRKGKDLTVELITDHLQDFIKDLNTDVENIEELNIMIGDDCLSYVESNV